MTEHKSGDPTCSDIERGDEYDYERWDAALEQNFNILGVIRTLAEETFTDEERAGIVAAVKPAIIELGEELPHQFPNLENAFGGLIRADKISTRALLEHFGSAVRFAAGRVKEKAPSAAGRLALDAKNHRDENDPNLIHWWLEQREAAVLARHLSELKQQIEAQKSGDGLRDTVLAWNIFSAFGDLQRLFIIVRKLGDKIDNEEIDVSGLGGRSSETCLEQIRTAKKMLLLASRPRPATENSIISVFDLSRIDSESLNNAIAIAAGLSSVKMWSV
jgi:hypothetical protein